MVRYPQGKTASYFRTDKIYYHGYFPEYVKIAGELDPAAKVCEIGVHEGESLRMWQSLFPLGEVTGVDNNPEAVFPGGVRKVIAEQDDPELALLGPFDLIVDDASHDGVLTRKTFDILWPQVNPGGFYVVEDWFTGIGTPGCVHIPSMLRTVRSFLTLLDAPHAECESVLCKYGLAILRKRA